MIDCNVRCVLAYRPGADGHYGEPAKVKADQPLAALAVPGLVLILDALALSEE